MKILRALDLETDLGLPDQYTARTPDDKAKGVHHVSRLLHTICEKMWPHRFGKGNGERPSNLRILIGMLFESLLTAAFKSQISQDLNGDARFMRLGEVKRKVKWKGRQLTVVGTPDALDTEDWMIEEWKATWMSCRQPITDPKFWHYWVQVMAYCYMVGTTRARLRVLFVNGDYSHGDESGPRLLGWEVEFTEQELKENWDMLLNHAELPDAA